MKSTLRILLIGSAAIASAGLASATLSYYDLGPVSFDSAVPTNYTTLSFAKFDTLGGTRVLTGVALEWSVSSVLSSLSTKNDGANFVKINGVTATNNFSISQGDDTFLSTNDAFTYATNPATKTLAGQTLTFGAHTFTPVTSGGFASITPTTLGDYSGAGLIDFDLFNNFSINPNVVGSGGNPIVITNTANGSATGSISSRYFYAIPEPGSLLALGCLVGSGAFLRTRRRHA